MKSKPIFWGIILTFILSSFISTVSSNNLYQNNVIYVDNDGVLSGYVTDAEMNPLIGARVRVTFHETYEEDFTDEYGYYKVTNIPLCYCLKNAKAFKEGYKTECVLLSIDETTIHNFILKSIGNTLYVGGNGPNNYTRIQNAIDNSNEGDTVYVYSGIYYENVKIDKSIILQGENRNVTIIDGNHSGDVIHISANRVYITGFTLRNASIYNYYHAGVFINSNNNTITGNTVLNSHSFGIFLEFFSHDNKIIDNNIFSSHIDGITLYLSNRNIILGNKIISNKGCGIMIRVSRNNNIIRNTITNNSYGILIRGGGFGFIFKSLISGFNKIEENNFIGNNNSANFHGTMLNCWKSNYWDENTNSGTYRIKGKLEIFIPSIGPFTPPFLYIEIPWINFDWNPAQGPYNISLEEL